MKTATTSTTAVYVSAGMAGVVGAAVLLMFGLRKKRNRKKSSSSKNILITGAASGLGACVMRELRESGEVSNIFALDVNSEALSQRVRDIYNGIKDDQEKQDDQDDQSKADSAVVKGKYEGARMGMCTLHPIQCDVSSEESVQHALTVVKQKLEQTGDMASMSLSAIVNCAGLHRGGTMLETSNRDLTLVMDVNVMGTCRINRVFFELMQRQPRTDSPNHEPRIINITSEVAHCQVWPPFDGAYAMSKMALAAYTSSLRQELESLPSHKRVHVVEISPGAIKTEMTAELTSKGVGSFEHFLEQNPQSHWSSILSKRLSLVSWYVKGHACEPSAVSSVIVDAALTSKPRSKYTVNVSWLMWLGSFTPRSVLESFTIWALRE